MSVTSTIQPETGFLAAVEARGAAGVSRCYQCRKCTNGCPLAFAMDVMPNQAMRMIQLGLQDELLRGQDDLDLCVLPDVHDALPNDIDIAHVMDALRQLSRESGVPPAEEKVVKFHEAVLASIYRHGRLFELGMVARYKLSARDPFADARLGWEMFKKGKLKFWPAKIAAKDQVRAMFRRERKG